MQNIDGVVVVVMMLLILVPKVPARTKRKRVHLIRGTTRLLRVFKDHQGAVANKIELDFSFHRKTAAPY